MQGPQKDVPVDDDKSLLPVPGNEMTEIPKPRGGNGLVIALAGGIALRLIWLWAARGITSFVEAGEATRVALSLGAGTGFSDAYFPGQGPTAHLMPVMVWIAGGIFGLFGPESPIGNSLLLVWALAQTFASYFLLRMLFAKLGADTRALRLGFAALCLVPVFVAQETIDFRYWEGALALCLATGNLLLLLHLQDKPAPTRRDLLWVAGLSAITFFVSPAAGLAVDGCWALFAIRRLAARDVVLLALLGLGALALLITPWAMRNHDRLGTTILLRSNFGLELAIGNYPGALSTPPSAEALFSRLNAIHPYHSTSAAQALRAAGGEVAYAKGLGARTERWIAENPAQFAGLCLRHYAQFFFPQPWQMMFTEWFQFPRTRSALFCAIDLLGLIGLIVGLVQRRKGYAMLAVYIALASLPYALVQPVPRYTYLVFGMLVFLAAQIVVDGARYAVRRSSAPGARWLR